MTLIFHPWRACFAVRSITRAAGGSTSYVYDNNGNMKQGDGKTLTYNAFNLPLTVSRSGSSSTFSYGADLQRYKQVLSNGSGTETTHYIGKVAEVVIKGTSTTTKVFIDDIAIVNKTQISGQSTASYAIRYTLRDRLGSVVSLTDEANQLSEHRSYDPFGKPRKGDYRQWNPATLAGILGSTPFTRRGFTDHEHLDDAQLIHMNGRVYDYNLGRFLSVDPIIQAPGNSQSLNPYSYIMNNPLAGKDPTGYSSCDIDNPTTCDEAAKTLGEGETMAITGSGGKTVGYMGKDNSGNVHIANNGSDKGLVEVKSSIAKLDNPADINGQREVASRDPLTQNINDYAEKNKYPTKSKAAYSDIPADESNMDENIVRYNLITLHHTGNAETPKEVEDIHRANEGAITLMRQALSKVNLAQAYEQFNAARQLVGTLRKRFNLSGRFIKTHGEFDTAKHGELKGAMRQVDLLREEFK